MSSSYTAVRVFSATKAKDREALGEKVTEWLRSTPGIRINSCAVRLSSDREFHCLTFVVFYTTG